MKSMARTRKHENTQTQQVRLSVEAVRRKETMSRMQKNAHAWNLLNKSRFYVLSDDLPSNQPKLVYRNVSRTWCSSVFENINRE